MPNGDRGKEPDRHTFRCAASDDPDRLEGAVNEILAEASDDMDEPVNIVSPGENVVCVLFSDILGGDVTATQEELFNEVPLLVNETRELESFDQFIEALYIPIGGDPFWNRVIAITVSGEAPTLKEACDRNIDRLSSFARGRGLCTERLTVRAIERIKIGTTVGLTQEVPADVVDSKEVGWDDLIWTSQILIEADTYIYVPRKFHGVFDGPWEWWNAIMGDSITEREFENRFEDVTGVKYSDRHEPRGER